MSDADLTLRVPFRDVDAHGHLHNAAHLAWAEEAIAAHLRGRGLGPVIDPAGPVIFAVKSAGVVFHAPSGYGDDLALRVTAMQPGRTSLRFRVEITAAGAPRATAEVVWVALDRATRRPVALPEGLHSVG